MLVVLTSLTHKFNFAGHHPIETFTDAIFGSKCKGSEIKDFFVGDYKNIIDGHELGFEKIVKDTKTKLKKMFDSWKGGQFPPICMSDILEHPYDSYTDETEFLVLAKLSKKIACEFEECGVRPNYFDETKVFLFRQMRSMALKLSLSTESSCSQYLEELESPIFTQKSVLEQQSVLDNIRMNCLDPGVKNVYDEWFEYGDSSDCRDFFKEYCPSRMFTL